MNQQPVWLAVLDQRRALLLRGRLDKLGRAHLELLDKLENEEQPREHGRPSPLGGKAGHAYASFHHEEEELRNRHAKAVSKWLAKAVQDQSIPRLRLYAPAPLLGSMRQHLPHHLAAKIDDHEGEFASLTPNEMAQQPAILSALA